MRRGYGITFIPCSWHIGIKQIRNKTLVSFGPIRFTLHRLEKNWKDY